MPFEVKQWERTSECNITLVRKVVGCSRENVLRNICIFVFDIRIARKRSRFDFLGMLMVWSCGLKKTRNDFDHFFTTIKSLEHRVWGFFGGFSVFTKDLLGVPIEVAKFTKV